MTSQHTPQDRLHRSRQERVLFGVCGGIATYLGVDPTIVRIAFVVVALVPPLSVLSLLGYPLLAIIMPSEETAHLPGRERMRGNVDQLRTDADELVGEARRVVRSVTGRRDATTETPPPAPPAPAPPAATPNGGAYTIPPAPGDSEAAAAASAARR